MSLESSVVVQINAILKAVSVGIAGSSQGFSSFIFEALPLVGKRLWKRRMLRKRLGDLQLLDRLIEAFKLGYVPGGCDAYPLMRQPWRDITLIAYFERNLPANQPHFRQVAKEVARRLDEDFVVHTQIVEPVPNCHMHVVIDSKLVMKAPPPPKDDGSRHLEYGNTDAQYWINWAEEIKGCIHDSLKK